MDFTTFQISVGLHLSMYILLGLYGVIKQAMTFAGAAG